MRNVCKSGFIAAVVASLTLVAGSAFAQGFHTNDVTPAGSSAGKLNGVSGGKQSGAEQIAGSSHAVLVGGNALAAVDLHPLGFFMSAALANDDTQQGGWGYSNLGGIHALVWNGSSTSYADLNPSGYNFSYCLGVHNGQQVGFAENQTYFLTASHAMLWTGSAATAVDLHPGLPYSYSRALGVHDGEQVGYASSLAYPFGEAQGYHTTSHAMRWTGTAASWIDLNPIGYDASEALATNGVQQGGWGYIAGVNPLTTQTVHAMLWSGTADSAVDLHPAGYTESRITALTATQQVGEGWVGTPGMAGSVRHALLWNGTANSVVDLNQYIPLGYTNAVATGIDANGNVVGFAYNQPFYGIYMPADAIAVVFAPGPAPAIELASIALNPFSVAPGDTMQGTVSLGGAAPAGGVNITFLSTNPAVVPTPAPVTIAEGDSSASFSVVAGSGMTVPVGVKLYATDGAVGKSVLATVAPVVRLSTVSANAVEGGFTTYGLLSLTVPAQLGGVTVTLSGDASIGVPTSVFVPQNSQMISFPINTTPVTAVTSASLTATLDGATVSGTLTLNPAPVVAVSNITLPALVGGQTVSGSVSLTNFPRGLEGATLTLTSSDPGTLALPATVTVPQGIFAVSFTATSTVVKSNIKTVTITASYNGTIVTSTVDVNPIPTVTISQADYMTDTQMLKVAATTSFDNSILTYGTDVSGGPLGTMQFELGMFKGSIILASAPKTVTVWNSNGGSATFNVTVRVPKTGGGAGGGGTATGGGGGGGGTTTTTTSTTVKLVVNKNGKGTVTQSVAGASFASGTTITFTATPDAGQPWIGWSGGACSGTAKTCTITLTANTTVTANFK